MPFCQLVGMAGMVDVDQRFVVEGTCAQLMIAAGEQLDHAVPGLLVFGLQVVQPQCLQCLDGLLQAGQRGLVHLFM